MWRRNAFLPQCFGDRVLQRLRPSREIQFLVINCNKGMDMIGHEDVSAHPCAVCGSLPREINKSFVNGVICEDLPAIVCARRDKISRRTQVYQLKAMESRRSIFGGHRPPLQAISQSC